ncbi:hypothetical protein GW943_01550 [Candidatus Parcubacteria bacterium]|uniref:Uncharacterized protein n=1 Tax=Candidatus Kaiserbacteria bacterium CG10_big_fil_rev_8_21_14_0_10_47_16 TaxID=1974608 RepID=A0A2H0UE80_9BACT|nr:hypothetical protein [Candidatus Parcubacteria bacterium]PIR84719.1 MAG: hypothetical protein COU16_00845 [Candidatus Kaiserbacteria bacterium CG10_big_fil_rev_8_21_14_0_10_47_16]
MTFEESDHHAVDLMSQTTMKDPVCEANMQRSIKDCGACRGCFHRVGVGRDGKYALVVICDVKGHISPEGECSSRKAGERTIGAHTHVPSSFSEELAA